MKLPINPETTPLPFSKDQINRIFFFEPASSISSLVLSLCNKLMKDNLHLHHHQSQTTDNMSSLDSVKTDSFTGENLETDVRIVTSEGPSIHAHSVILAKASPVMNKILERPRKRGKTHRIIPILGVPCDSVVTFIRFLYSSKCTDKEISQYGIHLLSLSHIFSVPELKKRCSKGLAEKLMVGNAVDVLHLSKLCDASDLYLKCMKFVSKNFKSIEKTEGWKFLQEHDAFLELEILQFIDDVQKRLKRMMRKKEEQKLYVQLSEAMECLEHICTEGCTIVGPCDKHLQQEQHPKKKMSPCKNFSTCQGLQQLITHFAMCKKRINGGCWRCKRMWQILRLHASICDLSDDHCKVPLCRQFKLKNQLERKGGEEDRRWRLLVRKVICAKVICSLSLLPKRNTEKVVEEEEENQKRSHQCC